MPNEWFEEVTLECWGDFGAYVRSLVSARQTGTKLWFRGQGDSDWPLIASFDRKFADLSSGDKANIYDHMVHTFRDRALTSGNLAQLDHESIICLMQHYGAPTRVLDWTTRPYIAAYFAFASESSLSDPSDRQRCAVFVLKAKKSIFKGFHTIKLIDRPVLENARAHSQYGRFTLNLSSEADLVAELRAIHSHVAEHRTEWILQKLTIPREDAWLALQDLELMGITSESVYLGLEGTAKYAFFSAMSRAGLLGP